MSTIGIFDSGSGGLSVFKEIYKLLPKQNYIYFADNAFCPYGEKSQEFIIERAKFITNYLINQGADIIVIACNTATGAAISTLRQLYKIPFIGMEPAVKIAALATKSGIIGVLATAGTLSGAKYLKNKELYEEDITIIEQIGQGWVELVENGFLEGDKATSIVSKSLLPLLNAGADNIVLGCTHYPFLKNIIEDISGPTVEVIDPAPAVARQTARVMAENKLLNNSNNPTIKLHSSGNPLSLNRLYKIVFNNIPSVCI